MYVKQYYSELSEVSSLILDEFTIDLMRFDEFISVEIKVKFS